VQQTVQSKINNKTPYTTDRNLRQTTTNALEQVEEDSRNCFLGKADKQRYGKLLEDMENILQHRYHFPKTVYTS